MHFRVTRRSVAAAIGMPAVIFAGWWALTRQNESDAASLRVLTSNGRRITNARIADFAYGKRPVADPQKTPSSDLLRARASAARVLARTNPISHDAAVANLVAGDAARAATILQELVRQQPANAALWNDLAAAYFEQGIADDDPWKHALSLAAADRALAIADLQEAYFNRALALEALRLRMDAKDAFTQYVRVDGTSPWAEEVRSRIRELTAPSTVEVWDRARTALIRAAERSDAREVHRFVARFPQEARTLGEGEKLAEWADAFVQGDQTTATRHLTTSRAIGDALASVTGDTLLLEIVAAIPTQDHGFAAACRLYRDGRVLLGQREIGRALPKLEQAERAFAAMRNPLENVAMLFRATALADSHDIQRATVLFQKLEATTKPTHHSLRAQLHWLRAVIAAQRGRIYESYVASSAALAAFERLREQRNAARTRTNCMSLLAALGDDVQAWRLRRAAFDAASSSGDVAVVELAVHSAARDALAAGQPDIARSLFSVELARRPISARLRFDALMRASFIDADTMRRPIDYAKLGVAAREIPDPSLRADALDELRFVQAVRAGDVKALSEVIEYRAGTANVHLLPFALAERARLHRAASRTEEAQADLENAIGALEDSGETIATGALRDTFFGTTASVYEALIAVLLDQGKWTPAFELSDRMRSRFIGRPSSSSSAAMRAIDQDTIALHYTVLSDRVLITVGSDGKIATIASHSHRAQIVRARENFIRAIQQNDATGIERGSEQLYSMLIAPAAAWLRSRRELIVIPDEATAAIPFAALRAPTGRLLVEDYVIAYAPSAAALNGGANAPATPGNRVAVVVDPEPGPSFRQLPRLPEARLDLAELQRVFPGSQGATGKEATRSRVFELLSSHSIAHIATHAYSSPRDASLSLIVLAPSSEGESWYLREIANADLDHLELIVLAGCSTAAFSGGSGSIRSLALAFLAAGARSVVATAWDVDDQASSDLTRDFYRRLARGENATTALRQAQLSALRSTPRRPLREWGEFQIYITRIERKGKK